LKFRNNWPPIPLGIQVPFKGFRGRKYRDSGKIRSAYGSDRITEESKKDRNKDEGTYQSYFCG